MHVHNVESNKTTITRSRERLTHPSSLAPIFVGAFPSLMVPCSSTEAVSLLLASSWQSIVNPFFRYSKYFYVENLKSKITLLIAGVYQLSMFNPNKLPVLFGQEIPRSKFENVL